MLLHLKKGKVSSFHFYFHQPEKKTLDTDDYSEANRKKNFLKQFRILEHSFIYTFFPHLIDINPMDVNDLTFHSKHLVVCFFLVRIFPFLFDSENDYIHQMIFLLMLDESCDENQKKTCQLETVIDKCINDGR